jgi:hypothetical protein
MKHFSKDFEYMWFDGEKYFYQVSEPLEGLNKK